MSSASHSTHRKTPSRAALPRRTTRGPLDDDDDPLSASATLSPTSPGSIRTSALSTPIGKSQDFNPFEQRTDAQDGLLSDEQATNTDVGDEKNLSFLLDSAIYHPLSQVDIPPPLRKALPGPPPASASPSQMLEQLENLLKQCDFFGAARFAALCLTSGRVSPTDHVSIFKLLSVRYSCLELTGQVLLAAQEAKALEDLSSEFYYVATCIPETEAEAGEGAKLLAKHIMPWSLRVQAVRLQSIGFSDPRRGNTALYDMGLEARENISSPYASEAEKEDWCKHLEGLSTHVINSLIELGDIDCAQRTLSQSRPSDEGALSSWTQRMVLILVKLGQMKKAQSYINALKDDSLSKTLCQCILAIANDELEEAVDMLESASKDEDSTEMVSLVQQNLAVAYLYQDRIEEARSVLTKLVHDGYSFPSLITNLATIYDLTSDRSKDFRLQLVNQMAAVTTRTKTFTNADFKL